MDFSAYTNRAVLTAIDLVNTLDGDLSEAGVAELLEHQGWVLDAPPSAADVARLRDLRATFRLPFGNPDEREVVRQLNGVLADLGALPQLTDHDGAWHWHYLPPGAGIVDRVAATASAALLSVVAGGGGRRLRVCDAEDCHNVYADLSRNGSRRFCSSRTCGNRTHVAAYRSRQRDST
jgi:predicted RNA-binding Zn ribbon-like protein